MIRVFATWLFFFITPAMAQGYLTPIVPQPYSSVPPGPNGLGDASNGHAYLRDHG